MELLTKNKANHRGLLRTHGQFLGSDQHLSLVALVRHLGTSFVSPQYHVVFDNKFETVYSAGADDGVVDAIYKDIFESSHYSHAKPS
ncbi:hypothetical protein ACHAWF_001188 [Thalassiosira exigua]